MRSEQDGYYRTGDRMPERLDPPGPSFYPPNYPPNINPSISQRPYIIAIIIGIILICVGLIIKTAVIYYLVLSGDGPRIAFGTGELLKFIGLMIFSIGIIYGALLDRTLNPYIRLGMFIALGLVIGLLGTNINLPSYYY